MSKRTDFAFKSFNVLAWIIFIGLCIETGGLIVNAIVGYFTQSLPAFQRKVYHPKGGVEACSNLVNFFGS
jgi:hypothetical protein